MGALHVHEFMTLDGIIDAPTWSFPYEFVPRMGELIGGFTSGCTGILLGRTTYEMFEPAWSTRDRRGRSRGAVLQRHDQVRRVLDAHRARRGATRRCSAATTPT